ncbi:MAG: hypothetical protein V1797_12285 [Pseudomonadota bacterium]
MKAVFVFIDDTRFELENFKTNAAPAFARAEFIYATNFDEAAQALAGRRPLCFLLDIYGRDPAEEPNGILPEQKVLEGLLGKTPPLESLYAGLDAAGDPGQAANLYLRRLYAQVERWQGAFSAAAASLGQGRAYGLHNLRQVRAEFPAAAALGFSRKALYADAVALGLAGAEGFLQKPQGGDDAEIAENTRDAAPELALAAYAAVDRRLAGQAAALSARLCREGDNISLAEALEAAVRLLGGWAGPDGHQAAEPTDEQRQEAARAIQDIRLEDLGLPAADLGLVLSLREWLALA